MLQVPQEEMSERENMGFLLRSGAHLGISGLPQQTGESSYVNIYKKDMYMALSKCFLKFLLTDFISIYPQITHYQFKKARLYTILTAFSEQL